MELDDLKSGWGVLNERLMQNEILNKRIVEEMIKNRTNSAYNKLWTYDIYSLVVILICQVFILLIKSKTALTIPSFLILEIAFICAVIAQVYNLLLLQRFQIDTKKIFELRKLTLKYKLWFRRNQLYGPFIGVVAIVLVFVFQKGEYNYNINTLIIAVTTVIFAIIVGTIQCNFYKRNIASIEKGLEELEEFEQE